MLYHIFCDETCQTNHRYLGLGGILIAENELETFEQSMKMYRDVTNMHRELKWNKVSRGKLAEYKMFVDYFFSLNYNNRLRFYGLVVDTQTYDYKRTTRIEREIGFYQLYYQLLFNSFAKRLCAKQDCSFIVHLDQRQTSYRLPDLQSALNYSCRKEGYGDVFRSVQAKDSKKSEALQINDILLGSIGFKRNGKHFLSDSSLPKIELANFIQEKAGIKDYQFDTPSRQTGFAVWNFNPDSVK